MIKHVMNFLCLLGFHKRDLIYEGPHTAYFGYPALSKCRRCGKLQRFSGIGYVDVGKDKSEH